MLRPYQQPPASERRPTIDNLLDLSVDGALLTAARRVFFSKSWTLLAGNESMLWGEYQLRNGRTVRPLIVIATPTLTCTCRMPQPCKHTLALLLFARQSSERMQVNIEPALWVTERLQPQAAATAVADTPSAIRTVEREARQQKRLLAMQNGVDELDTWLQDAITNGLGQAGGLPAAQLESLAARMVNAKLGGVARRLRALVPALEREDWLDRIGETVAALVLFVHGFRRLSHLAEATEQDIFRYAGVTVKKETVLTGEVVTDHWLVMGVRTTLEEGLQTRRVWLWGERTHRAALLLDYVWGQQPFPDRWLTGMAVQGGLTYYPGSYPLRAIMRGYRPSTEGYDGPDGYADWQAFRAAQQQALTLAPLLHEFPGLLVAVRPVHVNGRLFYLTDTTGRSAPMAEQGIGNWQLLALGGGEPLTVFGTWNGQAFRVYSAIQADRVVAIQVD